QGDFDGSDKSLLRAIVANRQASHNVVPRDLFPKLVYDELAQTELERADRFAETPVGLRYYLQAFHLAKAAVTKGSNAHAPSITRAGRIIIASRGKLDAVGATLCKAKQYFQHALDVDKNYPQAYLGLGEVYLNLIDILRTANQIPKTENERVDIDEAQKRI